jgi:hypothetical protein
MAFRYRLVHHPLAAADYSGALAYFADVDEGLANLFKEDFKAALRGIASGRVTGALYAAGHAIRWVKLHRFSYKVFFEPGESETIFVLAVMSGRRHPTRIRLTLGRRKRTK